MLSVRVRYSRLAMLLHWLLAAAFVLQIGLGWRMDGPRGPQTFAVFQLHKSIGITILLLTVLRVVWRLIHRPPPPAPGLKLYERRLAAIVHTAFYLVLLGMPLTGWLIVSSSKTGIPTILYHMVTWPQFPLVGDLLPGPKAAINNAADVAHQALAWTAYLLIALHVAGALKHQFVDRDDGFARMAPLPRNALGAGAIGTVLLMFCMLALGYRMHLGSMPQARPADTSRAVAVQAPSIAPISAAPAPAAAPRISKPAAMPTAAGAIRTAEAGIASPWTVRRESSSIGFHTTWSQGSVDGKFGKWRAAIVFDPAALASSSVTVKIDVSSATTGVPDTENALPGEDWFSAAAHPEAIFSATHFRHLGGDKYEALGTLSLRGIVRPLTLPFSLVIKQDTATVSGHALIDRTIFGVGQGEWASGADLPSMVSVSIVLKADRKPSLAGVRP